MQTKSVELTRNDMKMIKRALSMYKNKKASMTQKEFVYCNSLWKYIDSNLKELMK